MTFAEKLRDLRNQNGISQTQLAKEVGVTLRTIRGWEIEGRFPRNHALYEKLAEVLGCEVSYLMTDKEDFILKASDQYGYRGKRGAMKLTEELSGLFAGGTLKEEDMDAVMQAVQQAYWEAKKANKKYTPKKYRKGEA